MHLCLNVSKVDLGPSGRISKSLAFSVKNNERYDVDKHLTVVTIFRFSENTSWLLWFRVLPNVGVYIFSKQKEHYVWLVKS